MNKLLLLWLLIFPMTIFAGDFCGRSQKDIRAHLTNRSSRLAINNQGGFFGKGVCWWHNRLQRSAAYLAHFLPSNPPPSKSEALIILESLRKMNEVVVIPGYNDLESFTRDFPQEVQKVLNNWQRIDGFLNFEWIRGISGRSVLSSHGMKERMDVIFNYHLNSPTPIWIMAQIKGVSSHSFLVQEMKETSEGYEILMIDSNQPSKTVRSEYKFGDQFLFSPKKTFTFVPYVGFQRDFRQIFTALKNYCPDKVDFPDDASITDGEIELSRYVD